MAYCWRDYHAAQLFPAQVESSRSHKDGRKASNGKTLTQPYSCPRIHHADWSWVPANGEATGKVSASLFRKGGKARNPSPANADMWMIF
jgi:hypothetical protein